MSVEVFDDDVNALPSHLQMYYLNPHKAFGLDPEETTTKMIRDAFRRAMLGHCRYFWGISKPKVSKEILLFSYHILRRNIEGPCQKIKAGWYKNNYI